MDENQRRMRILESLDQGRIGVDQALRDLEGGRRVGPRMQGWWLALFVPGLAFTAGAGWMAAQGGGWWIGALAALAVGLPLMALGAAARSSPWIHVRLAGRRGRALHLGLPLPLQLVAAGLRAAAPWAPGLDRTVLDELLLALDGQAGREAPITIELHEGGDGERVHVVLG
jgi:hypothetical protein